MSGARREERGGKGGLSRPIKKKEKEGGKNRQPLPSPVKEGSSKEGGSHLFIEEETIITHHPNSPKNNKDRRNGKII